MKTKIIQGDLWSHGQDSWIWPEEDTVAFRWISREHNLTEEVLNFCNKFNGCIIAGAHAGFYVKHYAREFNLVYAIEPEATNFYCLVNNIQELNVVKIQAALSSNNRLVSLYTNELCNTGGFTVSEEGFKRTPTITIDSLSGEINLIHLDVEGHELDVLLGASKTIQEYSPVIIMETLDPYNWKDAEDYLLNEYNYKIAKKLPHDTIYIKEIK